MKYYKKPLMALVLLSLGAQSYADVLQTAVGANHTTPKVINQNENSTTSESIEIKPYGKLSDVNQDQTESIGIDFDQNPFIYGSGYHDTESDLEYMGARYYSAEIGRFMAQDSYDLINRYNYANANPIMYVDPDGHFPQVLDYVLNSVGLIFGLVSTFFTGGSTLGVIGGISGLLASAGGITAQVLNDNEVLARKMDGFSFYMGVVSIVSDGVGIGGAIINAWAPMNLEKSGFKVLTGDVLEKLPSGDYAIVSQMKEHLGFSTLKVDYDNDVYKWHTFDATNANEIKLESPVVNRNSSEILYRGDQNNGNIFNIKHDVSIGTETKLSTGDFIPKIFEGRNFYYKPTTGNVEQIFNEVTKKYIDGGSYNFFTNNCRQLTRGFVRRV